MDFPFQSFERKTINESKILTIDYSQSGFYVDHHGNRANSPKYYKKNEKKLKRLQRRYSRKEEDNQRNPSQNKQKALKELQKLTKKVTLQRKLWLHTLSYQIANEWECVGLEDLDLRNLAQALYLGKNLHDNGFGLFRTYLQYKLERQGKLFIKTDKFFPSSKRCSNCQHVNRIRN